MRFVVSRPDPLWMPVLQNEIDTYGDMIILSHLEETAAVANSIKSIMFFKHILKSGQNWKYVSKIDDDSYVDATTLYNDYMLSHIQTQTPNVLISRWIDGRIPGVPYPGGQFYTLSWDLMETICNTFDQNPNTDEYEDLLIGRLLLESKVNYTVVNLDNTKAFDYDANQNDPKEYSHNVTKGSINPHKMKTDVDYLTVAKHMLEWHQRLGNSTVH